VNLKPIKRLVTSKVGRQVLKLQKHSPVLLFSAGILGVVGTAVLASRATLKLDDILVDTQEKLEKLHVANISELASYSEDMYQRDKAVVYIQTAVKIGRVYAPALGLGILSVAALTGSHVILTKRNAALTAAYALLDKGFRDYRARVEAAYGPEKERELRYGLEEREVFDDEKQKVVKVKDVMPKGGSIYARCFDKTNKNWQKGPNRYNQFFLASQQQYCNDLLRARGHLFLNEVYDMLGMDRSPAGQVVGWLYDQCDGTPQHDKCGDNYVDFGIFVGDRESGLRFAHGVEDAVWLDFNVDGVIYDKI